MHAVLYLHIVQTQFEYSILHIVQWMYDRFNSFTFLVLHCSVLQNNPEWSGKTMNGNEGTGREWPTQITMLPIRQQTNTSDSAIQIPVQYQFSWFCSNTKSPCCNTSVTITVCNTGWVEYCIVRYSRLAHSHPSPATFILGRADCLDIWMTREKGEGEAISVVRVGGKGVRQGPHLSIRIVIWILPSDTMILWYYLVMTCSVFV